MRQIATVAPNRLLSYRTLPSRPLIVSVPQGFKKPQTPLMTEALVSEIGTSSSTTSVIETLDFLKTLPLGVPRFKKLPQTPKKATENVMYITPTQHPMTTSAIRPVYKTYPSTSFEETAASNVNVISVIPNFQSLPLSTSNQFESLTKVEPSPPEEELPSVDLKGHTIEELAAVANVSVETIKSAIKLRQQQLLVEKNIQQKLSVDKKITYEPSTMLTTLQATTAQRTTTEKTTPSTTTSIFRTTSTYVPKKKIIKKHPLQGSHKVIMSR